MMSSLTNLKAIAAVQNVEQKQISDSTGCVITKKNLDEDNFNLNSSIDNNKDSKKDDFKNLLNQLKNNKTETVKDSKAKSAKKNDTKAVNDKTGTVKTNAKDKTVINKSEIEEIEEKIENLTDEQLMQCLNFLADFLNQLLNNTETSINSSMLNENNALDVLSEELKTSLMEVLNSTNVVNALGGKSTSSTELFSKSQDVFNNIMELLKNSDVAEKIDANTLKFAENLLNQVSEKLTSDTIANNTAVLDLVNEVSNKINEVLNSNKNDNELSLQNNSLNNIYKVMTESTNSDTQDSSDSNSYSSSQSKDEKVLQAILGDKSTDTPAPVFTTTTTIVNNATGTVVQATQTVNIKTMAADVVQNVKYMAANDMREMVVKVNPGSLGEITIRLIEENGAMKLHMKAVSKETYSLLMQQSSDIKNALSDQNIKIHDVNISLYEEDTTFFKDGEFSNSFNEQKGNKGERRTHTAKNDSDDNDESMEENINDNAVNMLV